MDELQREELAELKEFLISTNRPGDLFEILLVLDGSKPGVFLGGLYSIGPNLWSKIKNIIIVFVHRARLKKLRNMLMWFSLFVSKKNGSYASKNKELCDEWDMMRHDVDRQIDASAHKFLGYPECCIHAYNVGGPFRGERFLVQLYSLFKDVRIGKRSRIDILRFLSDDYFIEHIRCKIDCEETSLLERAYERSIKRYRWLVHDMLRDFVRNKLDNYIHHLTNLPTELKMDKYRSTLTNNSLLQNLGINPNDVQEILENGRAFRETLSFATTFLRSVSLGSGFLA